MSEWTLFPPSLCRRLSLLSFLSLFLPLFFPLPLLLSLSLFCWLLSFLPPSSLIANYGRRKGRGRRKEGRRKKTPKLSQRRIRGGSSEGEAAAEEEGGEGEGIGLRKEESVEHCPVPTSTFTDDWWIPNCPERDNFTSSTSKSGKFIPPMVRCPRRKTREKGKKRKRKFPPFFLLLRK